MDAIPIIQIVVPLAISAILVWLVWWITKVVRFNLIKKKEGEEAARQFWFAKKEYLETRRKSSVNSLPGFPATYEEARSLLGVRPFGVMPGAVRQLELSVAGRGEAFPAVTAVSSEVGLVSTVSLAEGTAWLPVSTLAEWGVSAEQVVEDALSSLGDLEADVRPVGEGAFVVHGDVFAGAVWRRPLLVSQLPVAGSPVMWSAGEGVTVIIGDQSVEGFTVAAGVLTDRLTTGVELETLTPHRLVDQAWVPSAWPAAVEESLRGAQRLFAQHWYQRQREPLRKQYAAQGQDVNVPEYRVMEGPDGVVSAAACVAGVPNLVPEVDTVLMINTDGTPKPHSFSEFRERFASSLYDTGVSPARWLTNAIAESRPNHRPEGATLDAESGMQRISEIQDEIIRFTWQQVGEKVDKFYIQGKITDDGAGHVISYSGVLDYAASEGKVLNNLEVLAREEIRENSDFVADRIVELHYLLIGLQGKSPVRFRWSVDTKTGQVDSDWTYYDDLTEQEKQDEFWRNWKGDAAWKAQLEAELAGQ